MVKEQIELANSDKKDNNLNMEWVMCDYQLLG